MRLDLLIATFRRQTMLAGALESIFVAPRPPGLDLRVIIINNDADSDLSTLQPLLGTSPVPIIVLEQPKRGKSLALNLGLRASDAEYVGFMDDDERLSKSWFEVAHETLSPRTLDFIGGPMLPIWPTTPPAWIPSRFPAVLGIVDTSPVRTPYSRDFPGILVGGNAIVRRAALDSIGDFSPELGPQEAHRMMSCEDEDVYGRLLDAGARGDYVPELVVHHHVHPERMQPSYFRSWCFWNGASKAVLHRRRPLPVPAIDGVPRYVYGRAARSLGDWMKAWVLRRGVAARLEAELPIWQLAGHLYGRYGLRRVHPASSSAITDPVKDPLASSRIR